jgi:hypothetical protein
MGLAGASTSPLFMPCRMRRGTSFLLLSLRLLWPALLSLPSFGTWRAVRYIVGRADLTAGQNFPSS